MSDPHDASEPSWTRPDGLSSSSGRDGGGSAHSSPTQPGFAVPYPPNPPTQPYPPTGYPSQPFQGQAPAFQGQAPAFQGQAPGGYPPPWGPAAGYPQGYPQVMPAGAPSGRGRVVGLIVGVVALALVLMSGAIYLANDYFGSQDANSPSEATNDGSAAPGPSGLATSSGESWTVPVNAYCRVMDRQLKAVPKPRTVVERVAVLHQDAAILRNMNSRLRGMPVPQEHRSDYDAMLTAWEQVPPGYENAATAATKGDQAGVDSALTRSEMANNRGNVIANRLGLSDCAGAGGLPEPGQSATSATGPTEPVI
jgi:hypothetical protein